MSRTEILNESAELINGQRAKDYGDPAESFARIAHIWSGVLGHTVTAEQVALCLIGLKLSRLAHTPTHHDSWIDVVGYAALGGEISGRAARSINEGEKRNG